jgi:hypothetical protein
MKDKIPELVVIELQCLEIDGGLVSLTVLSPIGPVLSYYVFHINYLVKLFLWLD